MAASPLRKRVRLHITPLTPSTAPQILSDSALASISYHDIPTFPDRSYAFADVDQAEAEKLKRKYNGAVFRGVKMQIEEAHPMRRDTADLSKKADSKRDRPPSSKKTKVKAAGETVGVELPKGRRVQRGWQGGDKKDSSSEGSKCLFRTKMQDGHAADKKPKRSKSGKHKVLKEFEKNTPFPGFLKDYGVDAVDKESMALEYIEGKGWVSKNEKVIEEVKIRPRREEIHPDPNGTLAELNAVEFEKIQLQDEKAADESSASSEESEPEIDSDSDTAIENGNRPSSSSSTTASSPSSSENSSRSTTSSSSEAEAASSDSAFVTDASASPVLSSSSVSSLSDEEESDSEETSDDSKIADEDQEVKEKTAVPDKINTTAKPLAKPPSLKLTTERISQANNLSSFFAPAGAANQEPEPFKFFGATGDDDDMVDEGAIASGYPYTPLEARYRSAAPTPDTAYPSRMNSWLPSSPALTRGGPWQTEVHSRRDADVGVGIADGQHKLLFPHKNSNHLNSLSIWNSLPLPKLLTTGEVPDWRGAGKRAADGRGHGVGDKNENVEMENTNAAEAELHQEEELPRKNGTDSLAAGKARTGAGSNVVGWAGKKMKFDDDEELPPLKPSSSAVEETTSTTTTIGSTDKAKAEVWKEVFYKKRGEWNREWKRRRKDALKSKRKRERSGL